MTGLLEIRGDRVHRVIAMCKTHGAATPSFEEWQGFLVVTFKAQLVAGGMARVGSQVESKVESQPELRPESQPVSLDRRVLALLKTQALSKAEISTHWTSPRQWKICAGRTGCKERGVAWRTTRPNWS